MEGYEVNENLHYFLICESTCEYVRINKDGSVSGKEKNNERSKLVLKNVAKNYPELKRTTIVSIESFEHPGKFLRINDDDSIDGNGKGDDESCHFIVHTIAKMVNFKKNDIQNFHAFESVKKRDHFLGFKSDGSVESPGNVGKDMRFLLNESGRFSLIFGMDPIKKLKIAKLKKRNGKLSQISVGRRDCVLGVNHKKFIHKRNRSTWEKQPGKLEQISVGADGAIWGVHNSNVYKWSNNTWEKVCDGFSQVSVGSKDTIYGIEKQGKILKFCKTKNEWEKIPWILDNISCNSKGDAYGTYKLECFQVVDNYLKKVTKTLQKENGEEKTQPIEWVDVDENGELRGFYQGRIFGLKIINSEKKYWIDITNQFPPKTINFSFATSKIGGCTTKDFSIYLTENIL